MTVEKHVSETLKFQTKHKIIGPFSTLARFKDITDTDNQATGA